MTGSDDSSKAGAPPTEWDAASYHYLSAPQFSWGKKVIARLRLEGNETVMGASSGRGGSPPDYLKTCRAGASYAGQRRQNNLGVKWSKAKVDVVRAMLWIAACSPAVSLTHASI